MNHRDTAYRGGATDAQPAEAIDAPDACPFCRSVEVRTTSKAVNVSTYWRCMACGQIWNADRLRHGPRTSSGRFG